MKRILILTVMGASLFTTNCSNQTRTSYLNSSVRNPVGEKANFVLVKGRSDGIIDSGSIKSQVLISQSKPDTEFNVSLSYFFQTHFSGDRRGTMVIPLKKEFFAPEFLENLRKTGKYEDDRFKAEYLGTLNKFTTLAGKGTTYENVDEIRLYDIDSSLSPNQKFEDMEIHALVKEGIPVLGAISLDIKGTDTDGLSIRVRVGTDYIGN